MWSQSSQRSILECRNAGMELCSWRIQMPLYFLKAKINLFFSSNISAVIHVWIWKDVIFSLSLWRNVWQCTYLQLLSKKQQTTKMMYFKRLQAAQEAINYVFAVQSIYSISPLSQGGRNKNYYTGIKMVMKRSRKGKCLGKSEGNVCTDPECLVTPSFLVFLVWGRFPILS